MLKLGGGQEPGAALVFGWESAGHRSVHAASNAIKGAPASMMKNVEGPGVGTKLGVNVNFEENSSVWVFLDLANAACRSSDRLKAPDLNPFLSCVSQAELPHFPSRLAGDYS